MLLAARSVDVNVQDHAGNTALHLLAANRYADSQGRRVRCARWLVEAGGDAGVRDLQGRTAAELLREGGRDEELRALLLGAVVG
jgi:ankyrin repeat protein